METEWRNDASACLDHDKRFRNNDWFCHGEEYRKREIADGKIICVEAGEYQEFSSEHSQSEIDHAFRFIVGME